MSQSKVESAVEAVVGTVLGFIFGVLTQVILFPLFGIHVSFGSNLIICASFTLVSMVRVYLVRRFFETQLVNFKSCIVRNYNEYIKG